MNIKELIDFQEFSQEEIKELFPEETKVLSDWSWNNLADNTDGIMELRPDNLYDMKPRRENKNFYERGKFKTVVSVNPNIPHIGEEVYVLEKSSGDPFIICEGTIVGLELLFLREFWFRVIVQYHKTPITRNGNPGMEYTNNEIYIPTNRIKLKV